MLRALVEQAYGLNRIAFEECAVNDMSAMLDSGHTPDWIGPTEERVMSNGKRVFALAFRRWLVEQARQSVRYNRKVALRNVVAGQRVPMELTSLDRAYLAVVDGTQCRALFTHFMQRRRYDWPSLKQELEAARCSVEDKHYCTVSWQPEVVAIATPLVLPGRPIYVLNVSITTTAGVSATETRLSMPLLALRDKAVALLGLDH